MKKADGQHEDLSRNQFAQGLPGSAPEGGSDRSFGVVFAIVFTLIGCWPLLSGQRVRVWALCIAAVLLALAYLYPRILAPANRVWMLFGLLLGRVISPIMLGIVFYLVVTPTGLVMRLLRKDLLNLSPQTDADSYWIVRDPPGPDSETMKNQF